VVLNIADSCDCIRYRKTKETQCVARDVRTAAGSQDEETVQFSCESKVLSWQMGALPQLIHEQNQNPECAACFTSSARGDVTQLASHCSQLTGSLYINAACKVYICTVQVNLYVNKNVMRTADNWDRARIREALAGQSCGDPQASSGGEDMLLASTSAVVTVI
jgi:hypothetical protein